ncbi:hypothetical protein [Microcoleus sp. AT9b-C5]|uniref:hypothetical protein n=1 Tax=unclassified Microcoleus TaxID=2642155 RepID=UPI002FCFAF05
MFAGKFPGDRNEDCRLQPMALGTSLYNVHAQKSFGAERSLYFLAIGSGTDLSKSGTGKCFKFRVNWHKPTYTHFRVRSRIGKREAGS